ncbi:MAG: hypothetical protein IT427_04905 [Pirellulales bacterium]|nr:hypothetical protein [Pirellulales bacterium]
MYQFARARLRNQGLVASAILVWLALPQTSRAASFQFMKIVDSNTQVPSESLGVTYKLFGRPAINQSNVAYRAGYQDLNNVWQQRIDRATSPNAIVLIQKASTSGPTTGMLSDPTIYGTSVAYSGLVTSSQGTAALYTFNNGIATNGLNYEEAPSIYDGKVVYPRRSVTSGSGPNNIHIAVTGGGSSTATVLVDHTTLVPGGGGQTFAQFDAYLDSTVNSTNTNGSVAFMGVWSSGPSSHGIYRWDQQTNSITVIADKNTPIPNQAGNFNTSTLHFITPIDSFNSTVGNSFNFPQSFYSDSMFAVSSRPSLYGKTVSFNYDEGAKTGVYTRTTGPLNVVADVNTPHPIYAGNFKDFFESSTVGGSTAFTATDASGFEHGLFLAHCGQISKVVTAGDILDGKHVLTADLGPRGLSVKPGTNVFTRGLELAFQVMFTDGSQGIYVATTPQICLSIDVTLGAGIGAGSTQIGTVLGSTSCDAPVFDDLTTGLMVHMTAGAGVEPAVFGGSSDASVLGVDSLPGNNPQEIDFTTQADGMISESIAMSFNQAMLIDGLHLGDFGPDDSAILQIGGVVMHLDGLAYPHGEIPLPGLPLDALQMLTIGWDPANSTGNGFSLGGILATPVPEPASMLTGTVMFALALVIGRRRLA